MADFYKPIRRPYFDVDGNEIGTGLFLAGGTQADGHLAYSRLDDDGSEIDGEQTSWIQVRDVNGKRMIMIHI